jgi:hypothetical protein
LATKRKKTKPLNNGEKIGEMLRFALLMHQEHAKALKIEELNSH